MTKNKGKYHGKYDWFYQTGEWKALRAARFSYANGLCECCQRKGIAREGKEVHHIVPIETDWTRRLEFNNTILLCSDCHNERHDRVSPLQKFSHIWEDLQNGRTPTGNNAG